MNIPESVPDDYIIVKYGYTNNIKERCRQHKNTYEVIEGCEFELLNCAGIDIKFLSKSETG